MPIPKHLTIFANSKRADLSSVPDCVLYLPREFARIYDMMEEFGEKNDVKIHLTFRDYVLGGGDLYGLHNVPQQLLATNFLIENNNTPTSLRIINREIGFVISGYAHDALADGMGKDYRGLIETARLGSQHLTFDLAFLGAEYSIPRLRMLARKISETRFEKMVREYLEGRKRAYTRRDGEPRENQEPKIELIDQVLHRL
jgi:hypothetical protein